MPLWNGSNAIWSGGPDVIWNAPQVTLLPPLPAIGKVRIEIADAGVWKEITPQSMVVKVSWGADDPTGVLTVPAAGSWNVNTYDPQRLLDPANVTSPLAAFIRPGKGIRLSYINLQGARKVVRQGIIDEVDYDIATKRGSIRGSNMVQLMVAAPLAANQTGLPSTLRARATALIAKAGLTALVPVEATPAGETDPSVGPVIPDEASVWAHILTYSLDALYAVWTDRDGVLRFRSFGNPRDTGFQVGGADGIAIETMKTQGSLQGVFTHIVAFESTAPTVPVEAIDAPKKALYGDILLKRDHPVIGARAWVDSVLADRAGSSLQYAPGTLYPQTEDALESILNLGMIDIANLVVESTNPQISVPARVLGGTITADTSTGWTAELSTYVPALEWEQQPPPIEPPIEPPPGTISGVVRTYACTKDARLAHSSSLDAGNGTDTNLPVGYTSPYRNRAVLGFAAIPFAGVVSVDKAELLLTVGANSCGAFGSSPKVIVSRLTGAFNEGSYSAACGFGTSNSVVYPGPATTSSGSVTKAISKTTGTDIVIDITEIVRAWLAGQTQHGLQIKSSGEDSSTYTTAFYSRHVGTGSNRPSLRLTLTIQATKD
jgi:hypothetical protein